MNDIVQKATTELIVDGEQAKHELELINDKIKQVDTQLRAARKAGDADLAKSLKSQKEQLVQNKKSLQKEAIDVNKILNNLSTAKPKELNATIKSLTKQLNDPAIKRGSQDWKFLNDQIKRCKQELNQVNAELQLGQSRWDKATGFINKYAGMIATGIAAITGISLAFSKLRDERDKLESSAAGVKALTGLGDEDVAWLTDQAKKLSTSVTSEGVRIKQSATEISDSFGVIGSQRPELLANAEALKQVTQDAIYLSIAGKDKLEPAAKALTTVMNQMNLGASESRRIINAIAAGSQAGAGNIQYITDAFEKSGTTANMMNIQFEQLLGLIETVAPKYSEAAVAGTSLDRVLLRMKKNNIGYKDGMFDLGRAIDEINKRFSQGESATSLFGEEHAKMATILANSKSEVERYTLAVTGTNQAVTQANINSDINEVKRQQARNKMTLMGIELMDKLNPSITGIMNATVNWTRKIVELASWISNNSKEVGICASAILLYSFAINASTLSDKAKVLWTEKVIVAIKKMYLVLRAHPYAAIIAVIALVGTAIYKFATQTTKAEDTIRNFNKELAKEQLEASLLFDALKKANEGTATRENLIQTINEKYGQYLTNQLSEKSNLQDIDNALKQVNTSLENQIAIKMKNDAGSSITEGYINDVADKYDYIRKEVTGQSSEEIARLYVSDLKALIQEGGKSAFEVYAELKKRYGNVLTASGHRDLDRIKKIADEYKKDLADLDGKFAFINPPTPVVSPSGDGGSGGNGEGGTETKEKKSLLKIQLDLREEAEKMAETEEEEIILKNRKLELIDAEITRLKELGVVKKSEKKQKAAKEKDEKEKQETLKANANVYSALKEQVKQQYLDQEISEAVCNRRIELLDMISTAERIKILQKYKENASSEEKQLLDKRIAMAKKAQEVGKLYNYLSVSEEEKEDPALANLIEQTQKTYEYKQTSLKDQYDKGLLTQKEYQDQEREMLEEHLTEMLSSRMNFANQVSQVAGQAAQLVSALSQREEIAIENKYAGELKAAKGNAEKTAALNEQMEEEKKQVKKKYADIDFAITAAQIIASTAAGIMELWVKPGFPAAIPLAALVGATGIAQLLLANEQRQQVKNLWTGGYTSSGRWDEPKGIVHSEEFVGNRFAVRNKAVNRVFRMIDVAQKNNTIATINETDIIRALGSRLSPIPQKDVTLQATPSGTDTHVTEALLLLSTTVRDLKIQMQDGTLARTYVTGDGGTKTARDKFDKMLKNVTRYNKK